MAAVKFLCSYGGKILPRPSDGKLGYVGGASRVVAVNPSISFAELLLKLGEVYGPSVCLRLRCQLPGADLDALVSITSDEDLANVMDEYQIANHAVASPLKIRTFLSPPRRVSPPPSAASISMARNYYFNIPTGYAIGYPRSQPCYSAGAPPRRYSRLV